jgi:hypothetical protein
MPSQTDDVAASQDDEEDRPTVTAHESNPKRTVFTEEGNKDGWIATDLTVDLSQ